MKTTFEWDENKNQINIKKHGINFEDAVHVFSGPFLERVDERFDQGETRYILLGELRDNIVVVVYTKRNDKIRLISMKVKPTKYTSKTDWERLGRMDDSEIDYSDIPETDEEFWKNAKLVIPDQKAKISIRLDKDILEWFKAEGKGYQTKINAVLRSYIEAHRQ